MKALVIRTLRLPATLLLISSLTLLVSIPAMHGQAATPTGIFDHGPRNPGNVNAVFCPTQAVGVVPKFPGTAAKPNLGPIPPSPATDCIDIIQPADNPAGTDGAGNIVGGYPPPTGGGNTGSLWLPGLDTFSTFASVSGGITGEPMVGLGPSFNAQSCFSCHMAPAVGGTSPGTVIIQISAVKQMSFAMPLSTSPVPINTAAVLNPELQAEQDQGATNDTPDFPLPFSVAGATTPPVPTLNLDGPTLEVRFVRALVQSGNTPGVGQFGVGNLFTIQGRSDEPTGCMISQINFHGLPNGSVSFRIPTPTFGLGFVQSTPDPILIQNSLALAPAGNASGVTGGVFNTSGNDGSITRFGWKAQNKSLIIFAGEAENVEMGVTNELFPNERTWGATPTGSTLTVPPCIDTNPTPEDEILGAGSVLLASSNAEEDSIFMLLNAVPAQCSSAGAGTYGSATAICAAFNTGETNGQTLFTTAGCNLCHAPTLVTGPSPNSLLSGMTYHPYSDFALHHMGGLDDGITQGQAAGDQFRTAPLWGVGQRLFFMHDGRETDLINAIEDHCIPTTNLAPSEACTSVNNFNNVLNTTQQQEVLNFLRSL